VINAEPNETPDTIPVPVPAVATAVLLLLQVPPGEASEKVVVVPEHITDAPVIDAGKESTLIVVDEKQPDTI